MGPPSFSGSSVIRASVVRIMEAMEAAKQANAPRVWKEVTFACVENKEFKLAVIAGLNIITHPDHLEDIIRHYEHYGYPDELIILLENGLPSERAHQGIFTELGSLYAKYRPKRLMEHCKNYYVAGNVVCNILLRYICPEYHYVYSTY